MKLVVGWVGAVGMLAGVGCANAQAPQPYRLGVSPYVAASDVGGPYAGGPYAAMPRYVPPPYYTPAVLAPQEVYAIVRERGFSPLGAPQQRGLVYTIAVIDLDGEDGRLVIDARSGRVLRFMPAYRMGDRMGAAINTSYGPAGPLPPAPEPRNASRPQPGLPPQVASRTAVPLPKAPPPRAVGGPKVDIKPLAAKPAPAAVQQSVAVQPKPAAAPAPAVAAAPTPPDAKPAATVQPTQDMPPAQSLE